MLLEKDMDEEMFIISEKGDVIRKFVRKGKKIELKEFVFFIV